MRLVNIRQHNYCQFLCDEKIYSMKIIKFEDTDKGVKKAGQEQ